MQIQDVKVGQVFKDNDQPNRIQYPYIHVLEITKDGKASIKRTKDIEGKVAPRNIRTKISLHRLVGYAYSLVVNPKDTAAAPQEEVASPA